MICKHEQDIMACLDCEVEIEADYLRFQKLTTQEQKDELLSKGIDADLAFKRIKDFIADLKAFKKMEEKMQGMIFVENTTIN